MVVKFVIIQKQNNVAQFLLEYFNIILTVWRIKQFPSVTEPLVSE